MKNKTFNSNVRPATGLKPVGRGPKVSAAQELMLVVHVFFTKHLLRFRCSVVNKILECDVNVF